LLQPPSRWRASRWRLAALPARPAPRPPPPADANTSGDIPDTQAYVAFVPASGGYSLKVPEGWTRTADGSSVTFSSHFDSIRVETEPAPQAPTIAFATSAELPTLRSATPGFLLRDVTSVGRSAGDAVLIRYSAQSHAARRFSNDWGSRPAPRPSRQSSPGARPRVPAWHWRW
jgi:hypothetical protein